MLRHLTFFATHSGESTALHEQCERGFCFAVQPLNGTIQIIYMRISISFILLVLFLFQSCVSSKRLKRDYPRSGYTFTSKHGYDLTWDKILDYFQRTGTPVSNIDKASGVIVSNDVSFMKGYGYEKTFGRDKDAYVILPRRKGHDPAKITGTINVRLRSDNTITVGIYNLTAESRNASALDNQFRFYPDIASTGKFEKEMEAFINNAP